MKRYKFGSCWIGFFNGETELSVLTPAKGDAERLCEDAKPTVFRFEVPFGYGTQSESVLLLWKYRFTRKNLPLIDSFEFPTGTLEIYKVGSVGRNVPDVATYWVAYWNGEPYSLDFRGSAWRSDDSDYPSWVAAMKLAKSQVEVGSTTE